MGRPLGSKNKPRSKSQDSQRHKKRVIPILVHTNTEKEDLVTVEDELNERDRFTYIPHTRDVAAITLLPSDAAPQQRRYTILDRIENENEIPLYILREDVVVAAPKNESSESGGSQRPPSITSDLGLIPRRGSVRTRSIASPHTSYPIADYDTDDPSLLRISLLHIDNYVSPLQLEAYENKRFANPKPEDDPFANRRLDTSTQSLGSSGRGSVPQDEVRVKKPVGRPPKKRRLLEVVVVNNASKSPFSGGSILDSDQRDGHSIVGKHMDLSDVEGDLDMLDSIEHDALNSILESDEEENLRAFFPNKIFDQFPAAGRGLRSISTMNSRSSMAPPPPPESVTHFHYVSADGSPPNRLSKNTRSRAASYASAQSSISASRSESVVSSIDAAEPPILQPAPTVVSSIRAVEPSRSQPPMSTMAYSNRSKPIPPRQPPRPEAATAAMAKQLIAEQFSTLIEKTKLRLGPASPKRVSKLNTPSMQPAPVSTSTLMQKFKPSFTQTQLSFAKVTPMSISPIKKALDPPPPPEEEDEDEDEDEPEYEVSHILGHDDSTGIRFYRVAWVGFPEDEATWLNKEELGGAKDALKAYNKRLKWEVKRKEK